MIKFDARIDFNFSPRDVVSYMGLEDGGRVQKAIDKAVIDYSLPYWAWETGTMARGAYAATRYGSGQVIWPGPYAGYQYRGIVYGPNIPVFEDNTGIPTRFFSIPGSKKHPTGKKLKYSTDTNPLAGAFPIERMKADRMEDILTEAINAMKER
ncbi:MAG: hypothetical protein IKE17_05970 [Clostridia bacterium]|nr:hypothetical protein [Clostridia bacterium]